MGERIDDLKETVESAGEVFLDSSTGVLQGVLLAAWPVILMSTVSVVSILLVNIPRRVLGGAQS